MKKLLSLFVFMLISFSTFAQTADVALFRCTEASVYYIQSEESFTQETNFIIKADIPNNKISFDNKYQSVYYIRYIKADAEPKVDDDGDHYKITAFAAYDEEGLECIFSIVIYDELPLIYFSATYTDINAIWKVDVL